MAPECTQCPARTLPIARSRHVAGAGLGVGSLLGFVLAPKCPLCLAAYLTAAPLAFAPWLVALVLGTGLVLRRVHRWRRPCTLRA